MQFDYFYGSQAEQFSFYRIPKVLFTDPQFKPLSTDAKVLYGILLDRMNLSVKNQWLDEQSRVYIIFTTEEIMEALSCANQKACRLMLELEKDAGLIERKRQGLGKWFERHYVNGKEKKSYRNKKGRLERKRLFRSAMIATVSAEGRFQKCHRLAQSN